MIQADTTSGIMHQCQCGRAASAFDVVIAVPSITNEVPPGNYESNISRARMYKIKMHKCNLNWSFMCLYYHYSDVILSAMASQITSVSIVYSAVCSGADLGNIIARVTGLCGGNSPVTGEFPAQRTRNAEIVSIWWRHHESQQKLSVYPGKKDNCLMFNFTQLWWNVYDDQQENYTVRFARQLTMC